VQVIPAVDVLDGAVVRLQQGEFERVTAYRDDPVPVTAGFTADGAEVVHVVDLGAARSGKPAAGLWAALGAAQLPFQAAGGIRTAGTAAEVLALGAVRIVTGTTAVWDEVELGNMVEAAGSALVVAVDVKDGRAVGAGWEDRGREVGQVVQCAVAGGAARVMVTSVAADGMLSGPDLALLEWVIDAAGVPVIAAGGVGSLADVVAVRELGAEAVVVGRALYEGRFTLPEALEAAR
jgi:phosphoribosylformimino-5-aminoimidazole carboxamide ribotide isomerase